MFYSELLGKILHRALSGVEMMMKGLVERTGDVPGSGPEPEMRSRIAAWMQSGIEIGSPGGTGAGNGKAVEML